MPDIFLSYSSRDRERAHQMVTALEGMGWSVWWDREILPGQTWDEVIATSVAAARCVVVLWTANSVASEWCRIEAGYGKERGILVPALLDDVPIPLAFRLVQAAQMIGWNGDARDAGFLTLASGISRLVAGIGALQPVPRPAAAPPSSSQVQDRVLDAAISRELPVTEPAELITMVRRTESDGLKTILELEDWAANPEDVVSRKFELEFPLDAQGRLKRAELILKVGSPDFEPPEQTKKISVPPSGDSSVYAFVLTPRYEGSLLINLEVFQEDVCCSSRVLKVEGVASTRSRGPRQVVEMTLPVTVLPGAAEPAAARAAAAGAPPPPAPPLPAETRLKGPIAAMPPPSAPEPPRPSTVPARASAANSEAGRPRPKKSGGAWKFGMIAAALALLVGPATLYVLDQGGAGSVDIASTSTKGENPTQPAPPSVEPTPANPSAIPVRPAPPADPRPAMPDLSSEPAMQRAFFKPVGRWRLVSHANPNAGIDLTLNRDGTFQAGTEAGAGSIPASQGRWSYDGLQSLTVEGVNSAGMPFRETIAILGVSGKHYQVRYAGSEWTMSPINP